MAAAADVPSTQGIPADALALLASLPEGKITLPYVLRAAARTSDSFRAVQAQEHERLVAPLGAHAALDWRVRAQGSRLIDNREPPTPFNPSANRTTNYSFGVSKRFFTGTEAALDVGQGSTTLDFTTINTLRYNQSEAKLTLTQDLLKDALGIATRHQLEAAELQGQAAESDYNDAVERWALALTEAFYGAWLSQSQALASEESLARRERLLRIMGIKRARGTAESTDILQVESSLLNSKIQLESAGQALGERWRTLILTLKLPVEWLTIDPRLVPLKLDDPFPEARALCQRHGRMGGGYPEPFVLTRAKKLREAAQSSLRQAESLRLPEVKLFGSAAFNGINGTASTTVREVTGFDHPAYEFGVRFNMPLESSAERAQVATARIQADRADALASQSESALPVDWLNLCADLGAKTNALDHARAAHGKQIKRAQLEEERFRIGRTPTLNVIQAGDDATGARLDRDRLEVTARLAAWQVLKLAAKVKPALDSLAEAP